MAGTGGGAVVLRRQRSDGTARAERAGTGDRVPETGAGGGAREAAMPRRIPIPTRMPAISRIGVGTTPLHKRTRNGRSGGQTEPQTHGHMPGIGPDGGAGGRPEASGGDRVGSHMPARRLGGHLAMRPHTQEAARTGGGGGGYHGYGGITGSTRTVREFRSTGPGGGGDG